MVSLINVEFGWRGSGDIAMLFPRSLKTKLRVVPASGLKNLFGPRLLRDLTTFGIKGIGPALCSNAVRPSVDC